MTESKDRGRIRFDELAKLAETPEATAPPSEEAEENSGMINFAALASVRRPDSPATASVPRAVTIPPERGHRLSDPLDVGLPSSPSLPPAAPSPPPPTSTPSSIGAVSGLTARFPSASRLLRTDGTPVSKPAPPRPIAAETSPGPLSRSAILSIPAPPPVSSDARAGVPASPPPPRTTSLAPTLVSLSDPTQLDAMGTDGLAETPRRGPGPAVWLALVGGIGLGGIAAAAVFHVRGTSPMQAARSYAATGSQREAHPANAEDSRLGSPAEEPNVRSVNFATLPTVTPPEGSGAAHPPAPAAPRVPSAGAAAAAALPSGTALAHPVSSTAAPAASEPEAASASPVAAAVAPAGSGGESLEALMRKAVGATTAAAPAPPSGAAPSADPPKAAANVPAKPALGAVQGAVGAVLPAARYCLGPDDPISRATLTFQSDGSVTDVAVSGDAAGQPAEACIKSRLMSARVPPFTSPSFTWTVTVRPAS